jgi:hypothetical protein
MRHGVRLSVSEGLYAIKWARTAHQGIKIKIGSNPSNQIEFPVELERVKSRLSRRSSRAGGEPEGAGNQDMLA